MGILLISQIIAAFVKAFVNTAIASMIHHYLALKVLLIEFQLMSLIMKFIIIYLTLYALNAMIKKHC